uniref:Uncharacterized protein n=1 Tax=Kalanchoe fedtschenkoi TaxID=63787 RepID=A0A7N0U2B0_KALFE
MTAKVHPQASSAPVSTTMGATTTEKTTFTLWMKSLVFHGRGLAVFNQDGKVAYRMDNYGEKCSREVLLMDLAGQVLFTIRRKKQGLRCPCWEGYEGMEKSLSTKQPSFWVKEHRSRHFFQTKNLICEVVNDSLANIENYEIVKSTSSKSGCKITNAVGKTIAKVKPKQACGGVSLGRDVLSLEVDPEADASLVMALVAVHGLVNGQI